MSDQAREVFKVTMAEWEPIGNGINHVSCVAEGAGKTLYIRSMKQRAKFGGFLTFALLEDAVAFITERRTWNNAGVCIWRCLASQPVALGYILGMDECAAGDFVEAWKAPLRGAAYYWPPGTLAFKEVTLTEQLMGPGMDV